MRRIEPDSKIGMSGTSYDAQAHYRKQLDDIADMIMLDQTVMPSFVEVPDFSLKAPDVNIFKWLRSSSPYSRHHGEVVAGSFMSHKINSNITPNDIDIYFHSIDHANEWCFINGFKNPSYHHNLCGSLYYHDKVINLIIGIPFTDAKSLISGFDIRACAIAYDPLENKAIGVVDAAADCLTQRIVWQVSARHITVRRLLKYIKKGFTIDNYQNAIFVELLKIRSNRDQELLGGYK